MGLTTKKKKRGNEEHVVLFSCSFFRLGKKLLRIWLMGIGGSRIGQFGHGRPSDEETLRVRVDRIEGKPLGCHQFGNFREGVFQIERGGRCREIMRLVVAGPVAGSRQA